LALALGAGGLITVLRGSCARKGILMDLGDPIRTIEVVPWTEPVPSTLPAPDFTPDVEPAELPEEVPA
jgi:hypothetical protein